MCRITLDVESIADVLFEKAIGPLSRDFDLDSPQSPADLRHKLIAALQQPASDSPLEQQHDASVVMRAAAWALGSNMRRWSRFLTIEPGLREILRGYEPRLITQTNIDMVELKQLLGGQSGRADAAAMIRWARCLSDYPDWHVGVSRLGEALSKCASVSGLTLGRGELHLVLAVFLGDPPSRWRQSAALPDRFQNWSKAEWKAPGMGPTLASEFLRNLGYSMFKPDRHIRRLFDRWVPDLVIAQKEHAVRLAELIHRRNAQSITFLQYGLAGLSMTPRGMSTNATDNLVWALGAYVETKGNESCACYLCEEMS